jgi:hypothetical protein
MLRLAKEYSGIIIYRKVLSVFRYEVNYKG